MVVRLDRTDRIGLKVDHQIEWQYELTALVERYTKLTGEPYMRIPIDQLSYSTIQRFMNMLASLATPSHPEDYDAEFGDELRGLEEVEIVETLAKFDFAPRDLMLPKPSPEHAHVQV